MSKGERTVSENRGGGKKKKVHQRRIDVEEGKQGARSNAWRMLQGTIVSSTLPDRVGILDF